MDSAVQRASDMLITDLPPFVDQTAYWDLFAMCSHGHQSHLAGEDSGPWSQTDLGLMDATFTKSLDELESKQTRALTLHSEGMPIISPCYDVEKRN